MVWRDIPVLGVVAFVSGCSNFTAGIVSFQARLPDAMESVETRDLCLNYLDYSHPFHLRPDVKAELVRRGAGLCSDPGYRRDRGN